MMLTLFMHPPLCSYLSLRCIELCNSVVAHLVQHPEVGAGAAAQFLEVAEQSSSLFTFFATLDNVVWVLPASYFSVPSLLIVDVIHWVGVG